MVRRSFGHIRKLPSGKYQASYIGPNGMRRSASTTFRTKTDAKNWLNTIEATIETGRWRDPVLARKNLIEYAEVWIEHRPGLRPRTVELYKWLLGRHIQPQLARLTLEEVTPGVVRRWRADLLAAGVSQTMAAKAYRLLRAIMNTAVDDDILDRNPCRIRAAGTEKAAERPTLTVEQVQELCMRVPPRFSAFVAVKTYGSLRWGEITALHRRDVDTAAGELLIRAAYIERSNGSLELGPPKSRAGIRRVVLPEPIAAMLEAHMDTFVPDDEDALVFTGPSGRPMRRSNFNKAVKWAEAVAAIGAPGLHLHDLRHTGNTLAAATPGTSTRDLMERMGHDNMRAALIYQHATRDADRRIADALAAEITRGTRKRTRGRRDIARGSHAAAQRPAGARGRRPQPPETRGPRVASGGSAGVVQWQNISFPS